MMIMNILKSSLTGNVIGIFSLFVGIIGIVITIKTMKSAKRIEMEIKREKAIALDKRRFNKNKDDYLKKLKSKRGAASKSQVLSYALCNDVLSIINDLRGYKNIIVETDMSVIDEQWNRLKRISLILQDGKKDNSSLQEFDVIVSTVMNVLSKGEYDL